MQHLGLCGHCHAGPGTEGRPVPGGLEPLAQDCSTSASGIHFRGSRKPLTVFYNYAF